jgi:drug/metabolite transporter (DMT)-like permease
MSQTTAVASSPTPATRSSSTPVPLLLMVGLFCLLWSSAFSVGKLAIADCPPLVLLTARFLIAGLVMLGAAAAARVPWTLSRRDLLVFAALGVANQALYLGLGFVGLRYVSAGLSALIVSANPVVTAVFAALLLGERMTRRKLVGLVLGLGGVAFIVESRLAAGSDELRGILFTIAALLSLVGGTILFKRFAPKQGLWIGNGVQSLAAGIASLPFAASFESVGNVHPTWRLLATFSYLVLIVSVFAYLLWFQILTVSGATAASAYYFLMPPLGLGFGWLLLGEHVAWSDMLGIIPVVLGIYLVTRPAAARRARSNQGALS